MSKRWRVIILLVGALFLLGLRETFSVGAGVRSWIESAPVTWPRAIGGPAVTVCVRQGEGSYSGARDTDIYKYAPAQTNGADALLRVTSDNSRNFLIKFELPAVPADATVSQAVLRLHLRDVSPAFPMRLALHRIRRGWSDEHASWITATVGVPWAAPGCNDVTTDRFAEPSVEVDLQHAMIGSWLEFDITDDVLDWLAYPWQNQGYIGRGQGTNTVMYSFASSNFPSRVDMRPQLCITYYEATPTPTVTHTPTVTPTPTSTATATPTPTRTTGDIYGMVWHDMNANGRRDHEEPPLPGAQIVLRTAAGLLVMMYTTGGDGLYLLENIAPAVYWLQEIDPPGYVSTTINDWMVPVMANTRIEINFGDRYAPTATATPTTTSTPTATPTEVPCKDSFEPDDRPADAKAISSDGTLQRRNMHKPGDVDFAKFTAYAGKTYVIRTQNLGGGSANDTRLSLLAPDGITKLAENDDSPTEAPASRIEWICSTSGTYYIRVEQYNSTVGGCDITYDLSVLELSPTATPTRTRTPTSTRAPYLNVLPLLLRD